MAPSLPQFSAARMRSYIFRVPLFTRGVVLVIIGVWIVSMQSVWDVQKWGALIPDEIGLSTSPFSLRYEAKVLHTTFWDVELMMVCDLVYRTNTFPLIHAGFFHCFFNLISLIPLLERFEAEHGTLTSLALFAGRTLNPTWRYLKIWFSNICYSPLHYPSIALYVYRKRDTSHEHYHPRG